MKSKIIDFFYILSFFFSFAVGVFYFYLTKNELVGFFIYTAAGPLLLSIPLFLKKIKVIYENYNDNLNKLVKLSLFSIVYAHGFGSLGLYDKSFEYDQIAHFITLVFTTILLALLYRIIIVDVLKRKEHKLFIVFSVLFLLGILGGALTEIIQFFSDKFFGSNMFFDTDQIINIDVLTDMRANLLGSLAGILFLKLKWSKIKEKIIKNS